MWFDQYTQRRTDEIATFRSPRARQPSRHGVLMLVVLSMLVLFMLIGTAFLMSSSQEQKTATAAAKDKRLGNYATKLLERALLQAMRDTDNQYSVIHYHSLLRDLYGTNGFQGQIYSPAKMDLTTAAGQVTRYSAATAGSQAARIGPTNGQFIDLYVRALAWDPVANASLDDPLTPGNENAGAQKLIQPDLRHILKLDRDPLGQAQLYTMPLTKGYFNGQLLTITSGAAAGQTTRILDYEVVVNSSDGKNYIDPSSPTGNAAVFTRLFRFRVMAFQRTDGRSLQIDLSTARSPEITELAGAHFMVNGRAFSGTGVGYNPLAVPGSPRLSAVQTFSAGGNTFGVEIGLLPNSVPMQLNNVWAYQPLTGTDPFLDGTAPDASSKPKGTFVPINNTAVSPSLWPYQSFVGPGDANESYDAADFQNMAIALQTVTPRAQGRVMHSDSTMPLEVSDPLVINGNSYVNTEKFLRLDLEDLPLPSFHRPDLINFWYHRMLSSKWLSDAISDPNERALAILDPYPNGQIRPSLSSNPNLAALITAIKRQSSLRPLHEDNPDFNGSNLLSVHTNMSGTIIDASKSNIGIPYWEAVGPWDVDNDNDGVPDSVWVDIGDPVQEAEDGTRYKPLYAFLIVDLDSRLNVNAHGLADDIISPLDDPTRSSYFDPTTNVRGWVGNVAHDTTNTNPNALHSTLQLSRGIGYGPPEISLRPVFPTPIINPDTQPVANRVELSGPIDSYAALLFGRQKLDGSPIAGRYGFDPNLDYPRQSAGNATTAGTNYRFDTIITSGAGAEPAGSPRNFTGEQATPSLAAQLKFFDHPWSFWDASTGSTVRNNQSAFGTPPDLKGRYALGLDYYGQPVYEVANDVNPNTVNSAKHLPFNLLANSPYELDLSSARRHDNWGASFSDAATAFNSTIDRSFLGGQVGQNDDATFSPSDLEKVLRGWDPDVGTQPSRLWDAVDAFDPSKLVRYSPINTANFANDLLDPQGRNIVSPALGKQPSPEMMTGAQQLAGINRRLVTTDSFDLPVISATLPDLAKLAVGPDGFPGRAGVDDDNDNIIDDVSEIGTPGTDDFKAVIGKDPAQATIVDLLQYRVWTSARQYEMRRQGLIEQSFARFTPAAYTKFMGQVNARAQLVLTANPNLVADLLAPEVIAGKKMDLNRPFGDGQDNNGDGVVDDPLEAGEPFVDCNGNGKWDVGEPYIDLDHDGAYTPPGDQLWSNLTANGQLAEPIAFDYTNGHSEPLNAMAANALATALGKPVLAGVRNLESEGRQLFARHLYCLMLLLTDENYVVPIDERNPQLKAWMTAETTKLTGATPPISAADAAIIVKRKLTCRMIAQWAVNVVDARDADSIMTPFEYVENPWFGWGVWNDAWAKDITDSAVVSSLSYIPLDGDPATNESNAEAIDWPNVIKNTAASGNPSNINTKKLTVLKDSASKAIAVHPLNQTRGLVWGAERPELLMTETLAFHDRRTEDLSSNDPNGHGEMKHYSQPGESHYPDPDPDQSLRPRGSLFIEVYNPWSQQGQLPAELYSRINTTLSPKDANRIIPSKGVELGRLSNYAWDETNGTLTLKPTDATKNIKRSPVWRIMVVEEQPGYRNSDTVDAVGHHDKVLAKAAATPPKAASAAATPSPTAGYFVATDPDFDAGGDMASFVPTQVTPVTSSNVNSFKVQFPYDEREFYFTTDKSPAMTDAQLHQGYDLTPDYNYSSQSFRLRIPYRAVNTTYPAITKQPKPGQTQKFISPDIENAAAAGASPIAPILPGRYGVIGSAGAKYGTNIGPATPFITTIGRGNPAAGTFNTPDNQHVPPHTRRIELRPSNDPEIPQVIVANNGGDPADEYQSQIDNNPPGFDPSTIELGRDNELIYDKTVSTPSKVANITSSTANVPNGEPVDTYYQPCVAIPIAGMNISEPAWGYAAREYQAAKEQSEKKTPAGAINILTFHVDTSNFNFEGRYYDATESKESYDRPFDLDTGGKNTMAPELERTGSTPNYRTLHLQRLANPQLPWNPPPGQYTEPDPTQPTNPTARRDMNRPNMPINPYRTIDTASVNLTAFNGVTEAEANYPSQAPGYGNTQMDWGQKRPWVVSEVPDYLKNFNPIIPNTPPKQAWYFRSTERGATARLNAAGLGQNPITMSQQRLLWPQEPAMLSFKKDNNEILDMMPGRQMTMRASEVPPQIKTDQEILTNQVDMVMEHSLGFGNKSWGLLYDKKGTKQRGSMPTNSKYSTIANMNASSVAPVTNSFTTPPTTAAGAPAPFIFTWDTDGTKPQVNVKTPAAVASTDPWLTWNNRPYVSAEEILQIPCGSSSEMLAAGYYSTIDPSAPAAPTTGPTTNPYGQDGREGTAAAGTPAAPIAAVGYQAQFPFGHLLNFFAATSSRKDAAGNVIPAPQFYRILDFVHVPSRFVGTDTMLNAETFNDVNGLNTNDSLNIPGKEIGTDLTGSSDPRFSFQPPFNKVSRERDPGKVNLNTVTGRRIPATSTTAAQIWSEVYDGIMHRGNIAPGKTTPFSFHDGNPSTVQLSEAGPAWRDVVLSRRGYVQVDALGSLVDRPSTGFPDTLQFGLNNSFPTMFANPFRSADAADLVPLQQMMQYGVDATVLRKHPYERASDTSKSRLPWGPSPMNFGDARDAGFDGLPAPATASTPSYRQADALPMKYAVPNDNFDPTKGPVRDSLPLFSEARADAFSDTNRNPYMMYQPMSRLANLVTDHSNVYAIWITVGYFEVEKAPDWNDPVDANKTAVRSRFGATNKDTDAATVAGLALYNRVYPDGYMLGKELGSDTGDVKRPRGFYIIDRSEPVGFRPGEDLNVEKMIRLRRRIQ